MEESTLRGLKQRGKAEHAYPRELAAFVAARWESSVGNSDSRAPVPHAPPVEPLPEASVLEELLSTCYQASLLREEDHPVLFRLAVSKPEVFPLWSGAPGGLHRLEFPEPRPFNEHKLRRLFPATDYPSSIVGVRYDGEQGLRIRGLLHSGPR